MEMQKERYGFEKEFDYGERHYSMRVIPFVIASEQDKKNYRLEEGQFLVHLSDGESTKSFAVFYADEQPVWDSNVSRILIDDKALIERIGFLIDDYYS